MESLSCFPATPNNGLSFPSIRIVTLPLPPILSHKQWLYSDVSPFAFTGHLSC